MSINEFHTHELVIMYTCTFFLEKKSLFVIKIEWYRIVKKYNVTDTEMNLSITEIIEL